jgi:hypothetical protein
MTPFGQRAFLTRYNRPQVSDASFTVWTCVKTPALPRRLSSSSKNVRPIHPYQSSQCVGRRLLQVTDRARSRIGVKGVVLGAGSKVLVLTHLNKDF